MNTSYLNNKKNLILANETETSRQLALYVVEKPLPRVWMIFIPILFVFYFWKLKEYENGLKNFFENHLIPRRRALETAFAAEESGLPINSELLIKQLGDMQETTRALCEEWLTVLIAHFQLLLKSEGDSYSELLNLGYQNKSNYLLFCQQINRTETAFNMALLESIDGDSTVLCQVTEAMAEGMKNLQSQNAEKYFS